MPKDIDKVSKYFIELAPGGVSRPYFPLFSILLSPFFHNSQHPQLRYSQIILTSPFLSHLIPLRSSAFPVDYHSLLLMHVHFPLFHVYSFFLQFSPFYSDSNSCSPRNQNPQLSLKFNSWHFSPCYRIQFHADHWLSQFLSCSCHVDKFFILFCMIFYRSILISPSWALPSFITYQHSSVIHLSQLLLTYSRMCPFLTLVFSFHLFYPSSSNVIIIINYLYVPPSFCFHPLVLSFLAFNFSPSDLTSRIWYPHH